MYSFKTHYVLLSKHRWNKKQMQNKISICSLFTKLQNKKSGKIDDCDGKWIAVVKQHVNDKDELWRVAEHNWLWITRMQRLLQRCSYQSLHVGLCPDTELSSHSINQCWEAAALAVLLQPWEQDDSSLITPSTEWLGAGCHCICHHSALPISSKHVSC